MAPAPKSSSKIAIPCIRCGACCRWEGQVKTTDAEISRIARFLNLSEEAFIATCTVLRQDRTGLAIRMLADGTCIFLDDKNECKIHAVKPAQCKGYPLKWRNPSSEHLCHAVKVLVEEGVLPPSEYEPPPAGKLFK